MLTKHQPKKADEKKNIFLFEIDDLNFPKNEKLSSHQDLFLKASFNHKKAIVQNVNSKITSIIVTALKFLYKGT